MSHRASIPSSPSHVFSYRGNTSLDDTIMELNAKNKLVQSLDADSTTDRDDLSDNVVSVSFSLFMIFSHFYFSAE